MTCSAVEAVMEEAPPQGLGGLESRARVQSKVRIVRPPPVALPSLRPEPRPRKPPAVRLPTKHCPTVLVMHVNAVATPARRALWQRQRRRFRAQEPLISYLLDRRTRSGPSDNADCMPWLIEGSVRFCAGHHFGHAYDPADMGHGRSAFASDESNRTAGVLGSSSAELDAGKVLQRVRCHAVGDATPGQGRRASRKRRKIASG